MEINKNEVSLGKIADIFRNAALEVVDQDDRIYVKGLDFGFWVSVVDNINRIDLFTYIKCKDSAPLDDLAMFSEKLNQGHAFVKFSSEVNDVGGFINGSYSLYYDFGLCGPNLIVSSRVFTSIFIDAIRVEDADDVFF